MKRMLILAGIIAMSVVAAPAGAEWYVAGQIGANLLTDSDFDDRFGTVVEAEFETGIVLGVEVGLVLPQGFRVGGEIAYRANDVDRFRGPGSSAPGAAEMTAISFMGNLWYDFPKTGGIRPYIGGGVGLAEVEANNVVNGAIFVDDDETTFAFQLGAGLAIDLAPKVALTVDYRYFFAVDPSFVGAEADYDSHSLMTGLRFGF